MHRSRFVHPTIRIQAHERGGELILVVEGHLTSALAPQLVEQCWREEALGKRRRIAVDVGGLLRIDRAGRSLLRAMHAGGVRFKGGRLAVEDVLDEIAG